MYEWSPNVSEKELKCGDVCFQNSKKYEVPATFYLLGSLYTFLFSH